MTITSRDIKDQVIEALAGFDADYDLDEIVADLIQRFGRVHVDTMPANEFWAIVAKHDTSVEAQVPAAAEVPRLVDAAAAVNPVWFYFAAGLVVTVLAVVGVEAGYFTPVVRFIVSVWEWLVHAVTLVVR